MATDAMVTPTAVTPGFVAYESGGGYKGYGGPVYSSFAPADAAHLAVNATAISSNAVEAGITAHLIRDAVERRSDTTSLQAQIADLRNKLDAADRDRSKAELESVKLALLFQKFMACKNGVPGNGNNG